MSEGISTKTLPIEYIFAWNNCITLSSICGIPPRTSLLTIAVRTGFKNNPHVQIQFDPLASRPPFDDENLRIELLDRLNEIPEVNLPRDSISRYPSIPISTFQEESSFQKLIVVLEWTIQKIKN